VQYRHEQSVEVDLIHSVLGNEFRYRSNSYANVKADELVDCSDEGDWVLIVENAQIDSQIDANYYSNDYECIHGQQSHIFEMPHILLT
jgi:hypothetical protein